MSDLEDGLVQAQATCKRKLKHTEASRDRCPCTAARANTE